MSEKTVSLSVDVVEKETEKAFLFIVGGEKIWMPKGQIRTGQLFSEGDKDVVVGITQWIAEQKGLAGDAPEFVDDPDVPRTPQVTKEIDFEDIPF